MKKKKSKKKFIVLGIILILVVCIVASCSLFFKSSDYTEETVVGRDISAYYSFSGHVSAKESQTISADVAMQIKKVHVKEGDTVKKGDAIFTVTDNQTLTSNIDGEVVSVSAKEGEIYSNSMALATIINYDTLQAEIKIDEYDINSLNIDEDVTVRINALSSDVQGKVASISKEAVQEQEVTYFPATVSISRDDRVKIGMSCEVTALNQSVKSAPSISMKALQFDENNKAYVNKKGEQGIAEKIYVKTGVNDGNYVEILDGLSVDDVVLISTYNQDDKSNSDL